MFFLYFISQTNISGQQRCFLYITDVVPYPQMMCYICATALPTHGNSLAWETGKKQPARYKLHPGIYLKGKCPSSDKRKKEKKWTALLKHPTSKPMFLQHSVLPRVPLWVWSSTSAPLFESHLVSKRSCHLQTWQQPRPDQSTRWVGDWGHDRRARTDTQPSSAPPASPCARSWKEREITTTCVDKQ